MTWPELSAHTVALFDTLVARDPRVERRTLFGCPAAFVGGHLAACVFGDRIVLKLGDADAAALYDGGEPCAFEPMPGRRMRELFVVPPQVAADRQTLEDWMQRTLTRVAARPPREPRTARRAGRSASGRAATGVPDLPNIGPRSREMLAGAGVASLEDLRRLGSVGAFAAVRRAGGRPSLNLLWALEGALTGARWQDVAREHRTSLLLALDAELGRPAG
jgi:DNA transformation protein